MIEPGCDTIPKFIFRNADAIPDSIAMRRKALGIWHRITWSDLGREVERIAAGLMAFGVDDETCIAAIGNNEPELFWVEGAIQAVGAAATCLYPDITEDELLASLQDCGAKVVFVEDQEQSDKMLAVADRVDLQAVVYWDERGMEGYDDPRMMSLNQLCCRGDDALAAQPSVVHDRVQAGGADDLAVIIYTSGTTGRPKGVMGSHRYLLDVADRWCQLLGVTPGANYVSYISPAWATEQYLGLALGVSLPMVVNFPEEPETVAADMREIGPEFLFYSPRQWEGVVASTEAKMRDASPIILAIYRWAMHTLSETFGDQRLGARIRRKLADILVGRAVRDRLGFTHLKTAVNSGSTLSPEVFEFFHALGVSLRNVYGFTEIGIVTATSDDDPSNTVGKVLHSAYGEDPLQIRIHEGEIQVRGGVVFDGYLNHANAVTDKLTSDGWIQSGDAGMIGEDGRLTYLDRLDDLRQLNNGERIAPQFIETNVRLSPFIRDVIVVGGGRESTAALIDIDMDMVGHWAEQRQISFTSQFDLSQNARVCDLIRVEVQAINSSLPDYSQITRFLNLFKPFDADEGELTRSRKLRRSVIETKYCDLIDALYGDDLSHTMTIEMKYQDGRTKMLSSPVSICIVEGADQ